MTRIFVLALTVSIAASASATNFIYDATSKPASITSPNGAAWALTHDDLGNELIEASPDRGVVASTYDGAGNPITRTDARGITATHSYDALNRITAISYPTSGEDVAYAWDACANGKGRLCGVTDMTGAWAYAYDGLGRMASVTWTTQGQSYPTVAYISDL